MKINRLKSKWWAKLIAALLMFAMGAGCIVGLLGIYYCATYGVYSGSKEDLQKIMNRSMLSKYSVAAMANYLGAADRKLTPNYHYAIYEGSGTDGNKVAGDLGSVPEDAVVHEFTITDWTTYRFADSMFDHAYVQRGYIDNSYEDGIQSFFYYLTAGENTEENAFELYVAGVDSPEGTLYRVLPKIYRNDGKGMVWLTKSHGGEIGVPLASMQEFVPESSGMVVSPYTVTQFFYYNDSYGGQIENCVFRAETYKEDSIYTVVGTVAEEPVLTGSWLTADFFEQVQILLGWLYMIRYAAFALILLCFILGLLLFIFLMAAAGHREPVDWERVSDHQSANVADVSISPAPAGEVRLLMIERMPMDLALAAALAFCLFSTVRLREMWLDRVSTMRFLGTFAAYYAAAYTILLIFGMFFAANVKAGGWWDRTLIMNLRKLVGRFLGMLGRIFMEARKSASGIQMGKRAWAAFALFVILELIGLVAFRYHHLYLMSFWVVEKVIFFLALLKILFDFEKIVHAGTEIAGGNLEYKVETEKMLIDFADVGNSLNTIGNGIAEAVDERIKSERMKTELITNVSHDIKTPLTSIINYTDLLTKLNLEDPTAREYLEVLGRQSARLKKLIEDLIEASKASSGVLKLNMETVNASMLLTQALGEYEEKFRSKGLDLRVTGETSDAMVQADSRYLWRIFDNLMSNMLKYAQTGTRAYIDLGMINGEVLVTFRNISEMPLNITSDELLERFVRGDTSRTTEGSGLGLSIADSLTTLMGGKMELSVDGDLFKVIVRMPAAA